MNSIVDCSNEHSYPDIPGIDNGLLQREAPFYNFSSLGLDELDEIKLMLSYGGSSLLFHRVELMGRNLDITNKKKLAKIAFCHVSFSCVAEKHDEISKTH